MRVGLGVSFANTASRSCSPASGGAYTKLPVKTEKASTLPQALRPFESLRRESIAY